MRPHVAVLTVTRDRLGYSKHCFRQLRKNAGCRFDHYVFDNGSSDGTQDWLKKKTNLTEVIYSDTNIGISKALNQLLDVARDYSVIVKVDNDCELVTYGALRDAARFVTDNPLWICSPRIEGLNAPPGTGEEQVVSGQRIGVTSMIGGIFLARHTSFQYRYDEANPIWGMDDVGISGAAYAQGGQTCYLLDHVANHYETTKGQEARYPDYFDRKYAEMGIAR